MIRDEYRVVFSNGATLGPFLFSAGLDLAWQTWYMALRPVGALIQHRLLEQNSSEWTTIWSADEDNYLVALDRLRTRLAHYAEVALEQAQNVADYGTDDPSGGHGRPLYPIQHPLYPAGDRHETWVLGPRKLVQLDA